MDQALERLGLQGRQHQLAGMLSGGWKQRLALAACLIHEPRLLLLDEPTAGVDPKARRDFWDEIHRLAAQGITVLVSTHYMDEAARCHDLVYIAYGKILARGSEQEIVDGAGLSVWSVEGAGEQVWSERLRAMPGVQSVVAFGSTLHVAGRDAALLAAIAGALAWAGRPARERSACQPGRRVHQPDRPVAGQLRAAAAKAARMKRFSVARTWAVFIKEFQQMLRDRLTFAMAVGVPVMQLILFGYAINTDPKGLPTAIVSADAGPMARSLVAALQNTGYFKVVQPGHQPARGRRAAGRRRRAVHDRDPARFFARCGARRKARRAGGGGRHRPFGLGQCHCRPGANDVRRRWCHDLIGPAALTRARVRRRLSCACTAATTPKACRATTSCPA